MTAAAGRTGTVERTAACEAGRHHLCRGTIVSLTAAHGAPAAAPATAATCGDLSLVGLGSQVTPMRVNVLACDESIAFLGKRTRIDNQAALSWRSCSGTCRWRGRRRPPSLRRPRTTLTNIWSWSAAGRGSCSAWTSRPNEHGDQRAGRRRRRRQPSRLLHGRRRQGRHDLGARLALGRRHGRPGRQPLRRPAPGGRVQLVRTSRSSRDRGGL